MNILKSALLFFIVSCAPFALIYLIFEGGLRIFLIFLLFSIYLAVFFYADKFILFFLGAREIINADHQTFFRVVKSSVFNSFEVMPKVYLYSGNYKKAFVFDAGGRWSIAIDRKLLNSANEEELKALVEFLIATKKGGKAWLQTKCMGIIGTMLKLNVAVASFLLKWTNRKRLINTMIFLSLMFMKPVVELIRFLNYSGKIYSCPDGLKPIYYQNIGEERVKSFTQFISYQLIEDLNQNEIIKEYLESFPVFERCEFSGDLV